MCSQQVDNLSTQVDFVNVDSEYEPSFQLIPPFGEYDYKELVFVLKIKCKRKHTFLCKS